MLLEDGTRFDGEACGADGRTHVGEVVFTTGMSGYQESMTDPSFAGQLIAFTYPHIGNYGVSAEAMESERPWARAAIMREACDREDAPGAEGGWLQWLTDCGVPAISGVDTRALVMHIRDRGAMRGGVFPAAMSEPQARDLIEAEPPMAGQDLAALVTPATVSRHGEANGAAHRGARHGHQGLDGARARGSRRARDAVSVHDHGHGAARRGPRRDVPRQRSRRSGGARLCRCDRAQASSGAPPVWGICLGHQLLCRALGLQTFKLPFGHRGANHPVKDLQTGRIEITSQNHGFAVLGPSGARTIDGSRPVRWHTDFGAAQLSHVNLYDRTVEGFELLDAPGGAVQYHPEAGPGPHDSLYLFDRFLERIAQAA